MTTLITPEIIKKVQQRYQLHKNGFNGIAHWSRVRINGLKIANLNPFVDRNVIEYFAFFHDVCREDEGRDLLHGFRAMKFVKTECRNLIKLSNYQFDQLLEAIYGHTNETWCSDLTIGACWDADRLDLWRVGIIPDEKYLNVPQSKLLIDEAIKRSESWVAKFGDAARLRILLDR